MSTENFNFSVDGILSVLEELMKVGFDISRHNPFQRAGGEMWNSFQYFDSEKRPICLDINIGVIPYHTHNSEEYSPYILNFETVLHVRRDKPDSGRVEPSDTEKWYSFRSYDIVRLSQVPRTMRLLWEDIRTLLSKSGIEESPGIFRDFAGRNVSIEVERFERGLKRIQKGLGFEV